METSNQQQDSIPSVPQFLLETRTSWLCGAVFCICLHTASLFFASHLTNDFTHWCYTGIFSLHLTGSPYLYSDIREGLLPYHYPPLFAYLCFPLGYAKAITATNLWSGVNVLLTGILAFQFNTLLLSQSGLSSAKRMRSFILVLGLLMCYPPQLIGNSIGQMHNLVAVPTMACLLSLRRNKDMTAGLSLAIATLLKIFPGLIIITFLFLRRKRTIIVFTVTGLLFSLMTWQNTWDYLSSGLLTGSAPRPAGGHHYTDVLAGQHYISLPAMSERLFTVNNYTAPLIESDVCRNFFTAISTLAILLSLIVFLSHYSRKEPAFAALVCVSMLIVPAIGYYHLNLAVIAILACYKSILEHAEPRQHSGNTGAIIRMRDRWHLPGLVIALLLTAIPVDYGLTSSVRPEWLTPTYTFIHTGFGILLLTPQTYGLLILLAVCLCVSTQPSAVKTLSSNSAQMNETASSTLKDLDMTHGSDAERLPQG